MGEYERNRSFADGFVDEIAGCIGRALVRVADDGVDRRMATDMMLLRDVNMNIACRIRRHGYADLYPNDFTIRTSSFNGSLSELDKIKAGWANRLFYGHAGKDNASIEKWMFLDLDVFRDFMRRAPTCFRLKERRNTDGTSFATFNVRDFPAALIIATNKDRVQQSLFA